MYFCIAKINVMKFVRTIPNHDHLWAVMNEDEQADELTLLFEKWDNVNYLLDFFLANIKDLQQFFNVHKVSEAIADTMEDADVLEQLILDFPYTEQLDGLFHPLSIADATMTELSREKARNWDRRKHASWLRVYAIRLEPNVYVITGGAIKLTAKMQDRAHTLAELDKLNKCRDFLLENGVFDADSFVELTKE